MAGPKSGGFMRGLKITAPIILRPSAGALTQKIITFVWKPVKYAEGDEWSAYHYREQREKKRVLHEHGGSVGRKPLEKFVSNALFH
jgi:hypothetical protein